MKRHIFVLGDTYPNGTYLLLIKLKEAKELVFGSFKQSKSISLRPGYYFYIGSALATRGSTTLGNRLRRHTSRTSDKTPHMIQKYLLEIFDEIGISYSQKPSPKSLFWNIDHLLNLSIAEIKGIIFIRNPEALENVWSEFLEQLDNTEIFERGLGANDSAHHTHVQYTTMNEYELEVLAKKLPLTAFS
ncbi:MAG: DUF123 domain-containing protein [Candidatus Heimdallarchaeota archaeon]|nr:DUF123 domain-containing protein [Candidatus Heimdallarchaeota archaeon]